LNTVARITPYVAATSERKIYAEESAAEEFKVAAVERGMNEMSVGYARDHRRSEPGG